MNLSQFIEPKFNERISKIDLSGPAHQDVISLFWNFDKTPVFQGYFNGPGEMKKIQDRMINTWSLTDLEGKKWLMPQWEVFRIPQGQFQGFALEDPGKWIYQLHYQEYKKNPDGSARHVIEIFKKLPMKV
jgi:hypothetical protein